MPGQCDKWADLPMYLVANSAQDLYRVYRSGRTVDAPQRELKRRTRILSHNWSVSSRTQYTSSVTALHGRDLYAIPMGNRTQLASPIEYR